MISRGGAVEMSEDDDADGLEALRRFVKALLNLSEKVSPGLSKVIKCLSRTIENVLGVRLMPEKKKKLKKKKRSGEKSFPDPVKAKTNVSSKRTRSTSSPMSSKSATPSKTKTPSSSKVKEHFTKDLKSTSPNYRIQQELKKFLADPPPNLSVTVGKNLRVWIVTMKGAESTIYEGETFRLRISFPPAYPSVPPSVYFLPPNIPVHEHVYTNGDICLSLLGKDWRPTMTAQSIAVSILSILSSAQSKSLPMDNAQHSHRKPGQYQKDWVYHDDNVSLAIVRKRSGAADSSCLSLTPLVLTPTTQC
jgi:ubiquitin-conjugating enzyme E2 W